MSKEDKSSTKNDVIQAKPFRLHLFGTTADKMITYQENEICVIPGNDPNSSSQSDLDEALLEQKSVIVIKDLKLGTSTVFWLRLGRCLDRMSMLTAFGSIICSSDVHHGIPKFGKPLSICSALMQIGYQLLWSCNPLMHYRIAQGPTILSIIREQHPPSTILVRRIECKRSVLYTLFCAGALAIAFWNDITTYDFDEAIAKLKNVQKK